MMKPKKRTEKKSYWACTRPDHRHKTEEIAAKCIALWNRPRKLKKWPKEKLDELAKMREEGMTFKAIGEHYGISRGRIAQLYDKWWYLHSGQEILLPPEDYRMLSTRTINVLHSAGISKLIDITKFTETEILAWKNSGRQTLRDIMGILKQKDLRLKEEL